MEELNEDERRREFAELPKILIHGESALERHPEIRPEWIMMVIYSPYDRWQEITDGKIRTILAGRVPEFNHWIAVVFVGNEITGSFLTAYPNKQLI